MDPTPIHPLLLGDDGEFTEPVYVPEQVAPNQSSMRPLRQGAGGQVGSVVSICIEMGIRGIFAGMIVGAILGIFPYIIGMIPFAGIGAILGLGIGPFAGLLIMATIRLVHGDDHPRLCVWVIAFLAYVLGTIGAWLGLMLILKGWYVTSHSIFDLIGDLSRDLQSGALFFSVPSLFAGPLTAWQSHSVAGRVLAERAAEADSRDHWQAKVDKWVANMKTP